jgi:hypothetical protein
VVDHERAEAQHVAVAPAAAPHERPDARAEHLQRDRLHEVVVGARLEHADDRLLAAEAGHDEHRDGVMRGAQEPQHLEAAAVGHLQVENHRGVRGGVEQAPRFPTLAA